MEINEMKCKEFKHCHCMPNEPEDCWFCMHWNYWGSYICMIPKQEILRQLLLAQRHPNQKKLSDY